MLICLVCSNQEIKISSYILHAKNYADDVIVIGQDCSDNTEKLTKKSGGIFHPGEKNLWKSIIPKNYENRNFMVFNLDEGINFSKFYKTLKIKEDDLNEIEIRFNVNSKTKKAINDPQKYESLVENFNDISWMYFSKNGFKSYILNENKITGSAVKFNLDFETMQGGDSYIEPIKSKRITKKRKNPLIIFGIPGLIMVISSLVLVLNVVSKYDSIDSVSMGTAIITIGTTILGIISLMVAIISYILGKQTEFILTNYSE